MLDRASLLGYALVACGAAFLLVYPLAIIWPSGWAGHNGAPNESQNIMMIVGVYATLGVFLLLASRDPRWHLNLIWFTIWSRLVHAGIKGVQSWRSRRRVEGPGRARSLVKQKLIFELEGRRVARPPSF
jgi:hypothetical protein